MSLPGRLHGVLLQLVINVRNEQMNKWIDVLIDSLISVHRRKVAVGMLRDLGL